MAVPRDNKETRDSTRTLFLFWPRVRPRNVSRFSIVLLLFFRPPRSVAAGRRRPPMANQTPSPTVSIPQTAAAGLLSFTQPPQTGPASFYKIASGQPITFGWSFSGILATPTHLTVSAICDNGNTYPVGPTNGIIPGTATQVVWDVFSYQQANPSIPLAQTSYTLSIWDDRGPGAPRQGGFLSPNSGMRFALYTPQPYTPLASGTYEQFLTSNSFSENLFCQPLLNRSTSVIFQLCSF